LALRDASEFLGVHYTTLRVWADKGEIRVFRTPGGHRRFSLDDLRRFLEQRVSQVLATDADALVDLALVKVRAEMERMSEGDATWRYSADEAIRDVQRQRGRQLFSLAIAYVLKPGQRPHLLADARQLGRAYGQEAAAGGISLMETGRAVRFFRNQLLQAIQREEGPQPMDVEDVRVQRLMDQFIDEVLYAVLDGYQQTLQRGSTAAAANPG
jgi:excisionase family DNA binding protein